MGQAVARLRAALLHGRAHLKSKVPRILSPTVPSSSTSSSGIRCRLIPREQKNMTQNSHSKKAIRTRMADTGEPYSVSARAIATERSQDSTNFRPTGTETVADYGALILFCERMSLFTDSGLTFLESIRAVIPYTEDPVLKEALEFVLARNAEEFTLSEVVQLRSRAFRGVFPEFIRIFERGGAPNFGESMRSMANLYRTEREMERH